MRQEVVLAMLAKEPSHGYQLRGRLDQALGPLGEAMNAGQIYVTLGRLEKAGLVARVREEAGSRTADSKVYELTPAGQERVSEWLTEVSWPKPDLARVPSQACRRGRRPGFADPVAIVDAQRRELLRRLRDVAARRDGRSRTDSDVGLLLEGIVLRCRQTCAGWRRVNAPGPDGGRGCEDWGKGYGQAGRRLRACGLRKDTAGAKAWYARSTTLTLRCRRGRDAGGHGTERVREVDAAPPPRRA